MNYSMESKKRLLPVDATNLQNSSLKEHPSLGKVLLVYMAPEDSNYQLGGEGIYKIVRRPQLGFLYISGTFKEVGINHAILDQTCELFDEEYIVRACQEENIAWVGLYTVDATVHKVTQCLRRIKETLPGQLLVVGGPGTLAPRPYLDAGAEIAVLGEGEYASVELCEYALNMRELENIQGICYIKNDEIVRTQLRTPADLDLLPPANRDLIDVNKYQDLLIINNRLPYTTMITSRGCPFTCTFCSSPTIWNHKVRQRSVKNVLQEIDLLIGKYGVKYISFQDDIFGLNNRWLDDFCQQLRDRKYDLNWMCILHPKSILNKRGEMLDLMKSAGLDTISMGVQSADATVLQNISRRKEETQLCYELIQEAKSRQILTATNMIFGLPGESEQSIQTSIDFVLGLRPHHVTFYRLTLIHGSALERQGEKAIKCNLNTAELDWWVRQATRRYNLNSKVLWQLATYILWNKPGWLWSAIKFFPTFVRILGLGKPEETPSMHRDKNSKIGIRSC